MGLTVGIMAVLVLVGLVVKARLARKNHRTHVTVMDAETFSLSGSASAEILHGASIGNRLQTAVSAGSVCDMPPNPKRNTFFDLKSVTTDVSAAVPVSATALPSKQCLTPVRAAPASDDALLGQPEAIGPALLSMGNHNHPALLGSARMTLHDGLANHSQDSAQLDGLSLPGEVPSPPSRETLSAPAQPVARRRKLPSVPLRQPRPQAAKLGLGVNSSVGIMHNWKHSDGSDYTLPSQRAWPLSSVQPEEAHWRDTDSTPTRSRTVFSGGDPGDCHKARATALQQARPGPPTKLMCVTDNTGTVGPAVRDAARFELQPQPPGAYHQHYPSSATPVTEAWCLGNEV